MQDRNLAPFSIRILNKGNFESKNSIYLGSRSGFKLGSNLGAIFFRLFKTNDFESKNSKDVRFKLGFDPELKCAGNSKLRF